jgi:hypothetical protein
MGFKRLLGRSRSGALALGAAVLAVGLGPVARSQDPAADQVLPSTAPLTPEEKKLVDALAAEQVHLNLRRGWCWIPVDIQIRDELLEYLLVGPAGAAHESLFQTAVRASVLNTAFLALGAQPGSNATWHPKEPLPSDAEIRSGVAPYEVELPKGDGFHLYAAWRQENEVYCYRVEDLLRNLLTGHSMQRHRWIFLGSRMLPGDPGSKPREPGQTPPAERFAADIYQNLVNISFFHDGYTLLTGALEDCVEQTIWMPNAWLVPERGARVALIFARSPIEQFPSDLAVELPTVELSARDARRSEDRR